MTSENWIGIIPLGVIMFDKAEKKNLLGENKKLRQVIWSNALIRANQKLNLTEKRIIGYCISSFSKEEREQMSSVNYLDDYIRNRRFTISVKDFAQYFEIDSMDNAYRDVKRAAKSLYDRSEQIILKTGKNETVEYFRWFDYVKYNSGEGTVTLGFTYDIYKGLFDHFNGNYTSYNLKIGLGFKSFYSHRVFELLQTRKDTNTLYLSWDDFFFYLDLPDTYKVPSQLKRRVIQPVISEFKERYNIDLDFKIDYKKNNPENSVVTISANKNNEDIMYELYGVKKSELIEDNLLGKVKISSKANANETKVIIDENAFEELVETDQKEIEKEKSEVDMAILKGLNGI